MADPNKDKDTQSTLKVVEGQDTPGVSVPPEPDVNLLKDTGYKNWGEVVKGLKEGKKLIGTQGTELGGLRKQNKELTKMLHQTSKVLKDLSGEEKGYVAPDKQQVTEFMKFFFNDPVAVMGDVATKAVGDELSSIKESLGKIEVSLHSQGVIAANPKIKELPEALQKMLIADKSGKSIEEITKILKDVVDTKEKVSKTEKEFEEFKKLAKTSGTPLKPSVSTKVFSDDDEFEAEMKEAGKQKDTRKLAQLIASKLRL